MELTKAQQLSIVLIIAARQAVMNDKITKAMTEKSTQAPPPEREIRSWKISSERDCGTWLLSRCTEASAWMRTIVGAHALSPLTDRISG